jgi:hypothetical protein
LIAAGLPRKEARSTPGGTRTAVGNRGADLRDPDGLELPLRTSIAISTPITARTANPVSRWRRIASSYSEARIGTSWAICAGLKLCG